MDKVKEAGKLVDAAFDNPAEFKQANMVNEATDMVDKLLEDCGLPHHNKDKKKKVEEQDKLENDLENAPVEDPEEMADRVRTDVGGEESVEEGAIEGAAAALDNLMKLNEATAYQKFFQAKLKKLGVSSPAQLPADKKKEFFNMIDREWKAKKETD